MADTVGVVVGAITNGIKWVRAQYRKFKVWVADQIMWGLSNGFIGAIYIAGLVAASIGVGFVYDIMMRNAVVASVTAFLKTVGDAIGRIAAFLQVDMIIALVNLGVMMNEELYKQLAPLYDELGSLAEELELDFNYITAFLEVDRAILQATSSLTGFGFIEADAKYVKGLSDWLKALGKKMSDYAADPQSIFTDIQEAVTAQRIQDANLALGKIWAAIDYAGDWVRAKGEVILTAIDEIDSAVKRMPVDVQEAIKPWYNDAIKKVRDFEAKKWEPFWTDYQKFTDAVEDIFLMYGTDISELQRRIDTPLDWLRTLLAMREDERATLEGTLDEFLGKFLPVATKTPQEIPAAVADTFLGVDLAVAAALASLAGPGGAIEVSVMPREGEPAVEVPWYKERG